MAAMDTLIAVLQIVARRAAGNRRLLGAVLAGTVLAAALAASVVVYHDAVRDLGLEYALRQRSDIDLALQITSSNVTARARDYGPRRDLTIRVLGQFAGPLVRDRVRHGQSATFFLTPPEGRVPEDQNRPRAFFQFSERFAEHTRVIDGKRPDPRDRRPAQPGQRPEIEALIGSESATRLGVKVGQQFDLHAYWRLEQPPVRVVVAGIVEANDTDESFWLGRGAERFSVTTTSWPTFPFFIDESVFVESLAAYLPDMDGTFTTAAFVNTDRINARNAATVEGNLRALDGAMRQDIERTAMQTKLTDTLAGYRQRLFFTRLPLLALMLQIIGIVMYYLVMVGTMMVERQAGEIALLKSRGAATWQIMTGYALEGGALALAATLVGPPLAAGLIALLGPTPPFRELSGGSLLHVTLPGGAFGLAFGGALLALAALLWPAWRATRHSIVHYKQKIGRPEQQPAFLRYYLDIFLIVAGALIFYQLRQRGSLVTERLAGDLSADPLLLAAPALFMLMIALLFLRLFPLGLRLVTWLTRGAGGVAVPLGLRRIVRQPVHASRLILLLILVSAVGVFSASFRPTLDRSYQDRIAYQAGAPMRVNNVRQPSRLPPDEMRLVVTEAAGTRPEDATPVWRTNASYSLAQYRQADITFLGVRPGEFARAAFWRDDFSGDALADTLAPLSGTGRYQEVGPEVPERANLLGVWARTDLAWGVVAFGARIVDETGAAWDYRLDGTTRELYRPGAWQFYLADLNRPVGVRQGDRNPPLPKGRRQVQAIYVRVNQTPAIGEQSVVLFDDLQASENGWTQEWWNEGFSNGTVIEGFESLDAWEVTQGQFSQPVNSALNRQGERSGADGRPQGLVHEGRAAAQLQFERRRGGQQLYGLRTRGDGKALPVLASDSFLAVAKRQVGDEFPVYLNGEYVTVRVAGRFELFPTYLPAVGDAAPSGHLMVADLDRMMQQSSRVAGRAEPARAGELWFAAPPNVPLTAAALKAKGIEVESVVDRAALRESQQRDPLVAASWEGILFLSFVSVLLLTGLGFTVYSYLNAQTRTLEFAILRTMGLAPNQVLGLVSFEQIFVIVTGIAVGTLLGLPLASLMVGYMDINESGTKVVPPFVSEVSWPALALANLILFALFGAAIAALVLLYNRLAVHRALRMGEL